MGSHTSVDQRTTGRRLVVQCRLLLWSTVILYATLLSNSLASTCRVTPGHYWIVSARRTDQGPCRARVHKWGLVSSQLCDCGKQQTMEHIVDLCPITRSQAVARIADRTDSTSVDHLTSSWPIGHFLLVVLCNGVFISSRFHDIAL